MRSPSLPDLVNAIVQGTLWNMHTACPARVVEYDHVLQEAVIQPMVKRRDLDADNNPDGLIDQPPIVAVPVIFPSANTGILTFPVKKGDIVLAVFSEESLDEWLSSDGESTVDPKDYRRFNYADAFAIPGLYPFSKALGSHPENTVLRFNVGTEQENSISLKPNGDIEILTPGKTIINSTGNVEVNTEANAVVNVDGSTTLTSNGVTVNSDMTVNGNINCSQTVTATTDVIGGGKSLKNHTHTTTTTGNPTSPPN